MRALAFVGAVIARSLATLLTVATLVFLAIHLVPGNFADVVVPPQLGPQAKATLVHRYGLDQPLPVQYIQWLGTVVHGDLGVSLISSRPIADDLGESAPATVELTALAMILAIAWGIPLGLLAGLAGANRGIGMLTRLVGSAGLSVPNFVLGSVLVYIFSSHSLLVTVGGYVPLTVDPIQNVRAILLPAITLSIFTGSLLMRTTRDAVRSVLPETYIDAALARGETPSQVVWRHLSRNAANPVLTVTAISVGGLLGGAIIVENIFSIPGLGRYVVAAVGFRDYPAVEACVLLGATAFIAVNTFADLAYPLLDPRIGARRANR